MAQNLEPSLLVRMIRERFPVHAVPPYPPQMGLDPPGLIDEYAGFQDTPWPDVEPRHLSTSGFDISPAIGFALHSPPHMWNYYVPAFLVGCLLHEREFEITDGFVWQMRRIEPVAKPNPELQWWQGESHFSNYSMAQRDCVTRFLHLIRDKGSGQPFLYEWEPSDDSMLRRWETFASS